AVMPLLPSTMTSPPPFRKNNPNDQPILMLNLRSDTVPMPVLDDYPENVLAPPNSMVSGVAQVQAMGAAKYAVPVQLDPDKLRAQSIGLNEITQAITNWNVNLPTGQLFGPNETYNIRAAGQLDNAAAYRPIVVSYQNGKPIRLEQVAHVVDSVENVYNSAWYYSKENGKPVARRAITLMVMRQPRTNTIHVTHHVP